MEGDAKKWLIDCSPSDSDVEACNENDFGIDLLNIESLPGGLKEQQLFISASNWMPMSVENAFRELWTSEGVNGRGHKRFLARASFLVAVALERAFSISTPFNPVVFSSSTESICVTIGKCLRAAEKCSLDTTTFEILKMVMEILESLLGSVSRVISQLTPELCLELVVRLSYVSQQLAVISTTTLSSWKSLFESSPAFDHFRHHPDASVSVASLTLEANAVQQLHQTRPLPMDVVTRFIARISDDITAPTQIMRILPIIRLLLPISPPGFIGNGLSIQFVDYISRNGDTDDMYALLKCVNASSFLSACIWNLRSPSVALSDASRELLLFWAIHHSDHASIEAILDEISCGTKKALSPQDSVSICIQTLISRLDIEHQFTYLLHWLRKFEGLSDLAPLLTSVSKSDQVQPLVDILEIGFSVLHFVTPHRPPTVVENGQTSKISELGASVPASVYHELMVLVLKRMDVPSYFYHLSETREFDQKGYKLAELRVRAFQHLVGHYWYILESMLWHMPHMVELTRDNPILLVPEGVTAPIQFPPWFDALLVTMAISGMNSDFSTKDTIGDANRCVQALLSNCKAVKEVSQSRSPFSLRIRACISLVNSTKEETVDEANKFAIVMWLCNHVPMRELRPKVDAFDATVFNAVIHAIDDSLGDYRPKIKILGLRLVQDLLRDGIARNESVSSTSPPVASPRTVTFPETTFDAIVKSLSFREEELVEMALKVSMAMAKSAGEERLRIARASTLMSAISYEMDYVQKQELLVIYLEQLRAFLPVLGLSLLNFSHPLLVRLAALLDVGTLKLTNLVLDNIFIVCTQTWPRIHMDAEMIFGALAATWIDQVLVLPGEKLSDPVARNVEEIKRRIRNCLVALLAVADTRKMEKLLQEVFAVHGLESFAKLVQELFELRVASEK